MKTVLRVVLEIGAVMSTAVALLFLGAVPWVAAFLSLLLACLRPRPGCHECHECRR